MSTIVDHSPSRVRARPRSALDAFWGRLDALLPFEYVAVLPALIATLAVIILRSSSRSASASTTTC